CFNANKSAGSATLRSNKQSQPSDSDSSEHKPSADSTSKLKHQFSRNENEQGRHFKREEKLVGNCIVHEKILHWRKSSERMDKLSEAMQFKSHQQAPVDRGNEQERPGTENVLSSFEISNENTKHGENDSRSDRGKSWIDIDFEFDGSDFKNVPKNNVTAKKEPMKHQDEHGWLSTSKMREVISKRHSHKRTHSHIKSPVKSKSLKKNRTDAPNEELIFKHTSTNRSDRNCKAVISSSLPCKTGEEIITPKIGNSTDIQHLSPSLEPSQYVEDLKKNFDRQKPSVFTKYVKSIQSSEASHLDIDKLKVKVGDQSSFPAHQENAKDMRVSWAQNHLPRTSESDEDMINTSQYNVNSLSEKEKFKSSLWPQRTQELLSLTPSFKTPLCPEEGNHKSEQKVQYEVTDSEFFSILGIKQSQKKKTPTNNFIPVCDSGESAVLGELNTERFATITEDSILNSRLKEEDSASQAEEFRNLDQDTSTPKKDDSANKHPIKADENKLCSTFDTFLPPSQTTSEFSDYTDLDSIPFSQFELSEDLLSENSHSQSSKGSSEFLVRRRSRRISDARPFQHESPVLSASPVYYSKNNSSVKSEVCKYVKERRQSQAQQKKAAMVLSIFQFLQDKAKEPGSACDFVLTPDFDHLKRRKIESADNPLAQSSKPHSESDTDSKRICNQGSTNNILSYSLTSLSDAKNIALLKETGLKHGLTNVNSNSQQSEETESFSPLVLDKTHKPVLTYIDRSDSLSHDKVISETKVAESENVLQSVDQHSEMGCVSFEEKLRKSYPETNSIEPPFVAPISKSCNTNPTSSETNVQHTNCRMSQTLGGCKPNKCPDHKVDTGSLVHGSPDIIYPTLFSEIAIEEDEVPVCLDNLKVLNNLQERKKHPCDKSLKKNILIDKFCHDKNICGSLPVTKPEITKDNTGLHCDSFTEYRMKTDESTAESTKDMVVCLENEIRDETVKMIDNNISAGNVDELIDLKSQLKLNLVSDDSTSLHVLHNKLSPQVYREVSSPFPNHRTRNNFASPSNILNSLLSPVTPVVNAATPKNVRSLSRKSISFTSTPIPKPEKRPRTAVQKQVELELESPISRSRSASSASFLNTDLTASPGLNTSQDDLMPVYQKALSVILSPGTNGDNTEIYVAAEKTGDKNSSVCFQSAQDLELSSDLSLVPVCDESYPSPAQIPVSDKDSVNRSASLIESFKAYSPHVVQPWKKLARTATTPVQVLETETSICEHGSFSFTFNQLRGKIKPKGLSDMKSNMKFSGCFQSGSQDAVVSLLCGKINSPSHGNTNQAYIVSVKATSLTVWGADDTLGWTTELDWRLCPETHILKACLIPGLSRVAVLVTGWLGSSPFASVLTYEWDTEETMRFNIPFQDLPCQIRSVIIVEPCPASETELYLGLSSDDHHTLQRTQLSADQKELASSDLFQCCRGKVLSLVLLEGKDGALITLSYDQRLIIWSSSLSAPLKIVPVAAAMPCLQALVSAKTKNGYILFDSMWRVEDGHCGGLIVMNPLNGRLRVLHTYQVPNNTWRRVDSFTPEGQLLSAVGSQGSLCLWDRNTGKLLGSTKSNMTTCASLSISEGSVANLLVGEIHGCLHIYSALKSSA
ncbi:hypothetical protein EGW08_015899, partial [Elysia chlorotica]